MKFFFVDRTPGIPPPGEEQKTHHTHTTSPSTRTPITMDKVYEQQYEIIDLVEGEEEEEAEQEA